MSASTVASTTEPALDDVVRAAERLAPHLPPTPMWNYPALDATAGATVFVKHENCQPTGSFKVRGGLNYFATLSDAERAAGVVTYSTGNHAQSIAYAAAMAGATCVIRCRRVPIRSRRARWRHSVRTWRCAGRT